MDVPSSDRTMFGSTTPCRLACAYCFADFKRFPVENPLPNFLEENLREAGIIYPACNAEFFDDRDAMSELERLVDSARTSVLVSISVKSRLSKNQIRFLRQLNDRLSDDHRGLIKCSVSLSAKEHLKIYEPKAPRYFRRLEVLKSLADENIPTSVNLRPILPDVPSGEYREIISETAPYTQAYLLGGLYIDSKSDFGSDIKARYSHFIKLRPVVWLPHKPVWEYCEIESQFNEVRESIAGNNRQSFDTDLDVIQYLCSQSARGPSNKVGLEASRDLLPVGKLDLSIGEDERAAMAGNAKANSPSY